MAGLGPTPGPVYTWLLSQRRVAWKVWRATHCGLWDRAATLCPGHFLRELPLIFPQKPPIAPLRAAKTALDGEEGAFDPAAHEWQKPGGGKEERKPLRRVKAINLSHEHVPLTSGLATPG